MNVLFLVLKHTHSAVYRGCSADALPSLNPHIQKSADSVDIVRGKASLLIKDLLVAVCRKNKQYA